MTTRATFSLLAVLWLVQPAFASGLGGAESLDVFDGRWRLPERHSLVTELQGGETAGLRQSTMPRERRFGGDALSVRYRFEIGDWFAKANYGHTDDTIRAGNEFERQVGDQHTELVVGRSWDGSGRWWTRKTLRTTYQTRQLNDGQVLADTYSTELGLSGNLHSQLQVQYRSGREFQGGLLFEFDRTLVNGRIRPFAELEIGVLTDFGEKLDFANTRLANQERIDPFVDWAVNDRLQLRLSGSRVNLDTREGQRILDASMLDAQLTWQIDWRGSISVTLQQQDIARNPDAYIQSVAARSKDTGRELVYSWRLNPQAEFSFGYSDVYSNDAEISALAERESNWFMRFGYTL